MLHHITHQNNPVLFIRKFIADNIQYLKARTRPTVFGSFTGDGNAILVNIYPINRYRKSFSQGNCA